jgi:hypothetical protein
MVSERCSKPPFSRNYRFEKAKQAGTPRRDDLSATPEAGFRDRHRELRGPQPPSVEQILMTPEPWHENDTGRLELLNRVKLWRYLTGDPDYDADSWATRLETLADA